MDMVNALMECKVNNGGFVSCKELLPNTFVVWRGDAYYLQCNTDNSKHNRVKRSTKSNVCNSQLMYLGTTEEEAMRNLTYSYGIPTEVDWQYTDLNGQSCTVGSAPSFTDWLRNFGWLFVVQLVITYSIYSGYLMREVLPFMKALFNR